MADGLQELMIRRHWKRVIPIEEAWGFQRMLASTATRWPSEDAHSGPAVLQGRVRASTPIDW
jgi:hypothetical protein